MSPAAVPTGLPTLYPLLDGKNVPIPLDQVEITARKVKSVRSAGSGRRRETATYGGDGFPVYIVKHEFRIRAQHVRGAAGELLDWLLASPSPHTFSLWRPVRLVYACDGSRSEFFLPWQLAQHLYTPPQGIAASVFDPIVKVGIDGTELACEPVDAGTYEGSTPGAGEAFVLDEGQAFQLAAAPLAGALVYVSVVPLFEVFEADSAPGQSFDRSQREPRDVVLVER